MTYAMMATVVLIELHTPTDQLIIINPAEVSTMIDPDQFSERHFIQGTNCVVIMTNARLNATAEHCEAIEQMIKELH